MIRVRQRLVGLVARGLVENGREPWWTPVLLPALWRALRRL